MTLEEHTKAVGAFLLELAETMGVDLEPEEGAVTVAETCDLILKRARADREDAAAWHPLRHQLTLPQFLVCTHQGAVDPTKRYAEVIFKFHGAGALDRSAALHDALLTAARSVNPKVAQS